MSKCEHHDGRKADADTSFGKKFCAKCAAQIKQAQSQIDRHVTPRDCFVRYEGGVNGWAVPRGTGCAHWVAHQRNIKQGFKCNRCALEYSFRVPDVISGARKIDRKQEDVKTNDIWANEKKDHCGLVVKVEETKGKDGEVKQKITIRHCTNGQGGVFSNDFDTHFKGKGNFYRR